MARVRLALGNRGADQHSIALFLAGFGTVGVVSLRQAAQAVVVIRVGRSSLASAIFLACIAPWMARNYQIFGKFIFIRDNFGAELRLGNGNGADGTWMQYLHPTQDLYAMRQYTTMGELAYIAMCKRQAVDYIKADYWPLCHTLPETLHIFLGRDHPGSHKSGGWRDEKLTVPRIICPNVLGTWGALCAGVKPGAWLLFWLILLYPAIYYVVFPGQRYRHPIEPEMTILGVYLLTEADFRKKASRLK